jgi:DNA-binding response OmpR family regulator
MAATGDEALSKASGVAYDTVVLDVLLPGMSGLSVLSTLRASGARTPVRSSPPGTPSTTRFAG